MNTNIFEQFTQISDENLAKIEGGVGYRWHCSDGFSSAWHAFRKTAENNARGYEKIHRGVTCSVMYD
ncbi:ComC/BlpC family peptide pheromone/bacteriocin [Streptococcus uberis]|uniref:ComC/BlpC family peptide pheromone/bacteriocin n=1 Tax=Streptococcus uberis TaxID=1349 RepID=UPI00193ABF94|nr:ComC/BlpC family peptide pheromone/bacteriocin [Streptococcus uberis]MCK1221403.1 ComC/BlpC family peptide pheromone/bacteriocin [Streptococcus uberis]